MSLSSTRFMGDTRYGRFREGEASPVLMVCFTMFALPSGAGDNSNISLYSLKRDCKRLDLEGAESLYSTWPRTAEDKSESSEEVSSNDVNITYARLSS